MDVLYIAFLLLSIFEWFYAIIQGWGHANFFKEVFGGLKPCSKLVCKRVSSGISRRQMDQILHVDAGGPIWVSFLANYAERSSLGTIMGPIDMIPCVWHDKDGAMDSFLWKLWASSMCNGHVGRVCRAF